MAKRKRPIDGVARRYVWALYPTPGQAVMLRNQAAACADLWNALLEICERRYSRSRQGRHVWHCARCATESDAAGKPAFCDMHRPPSEFMMGYWISDLLQEDAEWRALSTWTPRRIATSLAAAFDAFFRRVRTGEEPGYPRYKSRRYALSIPHRCVSGCKLIKSPRHRSSWELYIKGIGKIWARGVVPASVNEWTDMDIMYRAGRWEASAAIAIARRREPGRFATTIKLDLIDCFALVNNVPQTPDGLLQAQLLQDKCDAMKSDCDRRWPRGKRYGMEEWRERCEVWAEIGRLSSRIARIRTNALHVWTTHIVRNASDLTVITPALKQCTESPRGDARSWGAQTEVVSDLNRNTLSYAPASAVAMLKYKAEEAGIRCEIIEDGRPNIAVGGELVTAGKELRRARRIIKRSNAA